VLAPAKNRHDPGPVTDGMLERAVGREFLEAQRAWSDNLDWELLSFAMRVLGKEGASKMLGGAT